MAYFLIISSYVGKKYFEMGRYISGYMTSLFRFPRIVSLWKMMSNLPAVNSYLEFIIPPSFILTHLIILLSYLQFFILFIHIRFSIWIQHSIVISFPEFKYFLDFNFEFIKWIYINIIIFYSFIIVEIY